MILSTVLGALTVYYAGAFDDGGRAVGDAIRYVGSTDDDCCSPDAFGNPAGSLRVTYARLGTAEFPPNINAVWGTCRAKSVAEIRVRVMRCWPSKPETRPDEFDAAAVDIADDAWILGCATNALMAAPGLLDLCADDDARLGCSIGGWTLLPVEPSGGCAGNELTLYVSLAGPCTVVRDSGS